MGINWKISELVDDLLNDRTIIKYMDGVEADNPSDYEKD